MSFCFESYRASGLLSRQCTCRDPPFLSTVVCACVYLVLKRRLHILEKIGVSQLTPNSKTIAVYYFFFTLFFS